MLQPKSVGQLRDSPSCGVGAVAEISGYHLAACRNVFRTHPSTCHARQVGSVSGPKAQQMYPAFRPTQQTSKDHGDIAGAAYAADSIAAWTHRGQSVGKSPRFTCTSSDVAMPEKQGHGRLSGSLIVGSPGSNSEREAADASCASPTTSTRFMPGNAYSRRKAASTVRIGRWALMPMTCRALLFHGSEPPGCNNLLVAEIQRVHPLIMSAVSDLRGQVHTQPFAPSECPVLTHPLMLHLQPLAAFRQPLEPRRDSAFRTEETARYIPCFLLLTAWMR